MAQPLPPRNAIQTTRRLALRWGTASALFGLGLVPTPGAAADSTLATGANLPAELMRALPGAQALGSARLRFLGLDIYEARLWASSGFQAGAYARNPFALELVYFRSLSGKLIAERSLKEMRRQESLSPAQEQSWMDAMLQSFADVKTGDRFTGLHLPGVGASFWHNGQGRPAVRDADFSRLFFGIWLSDATSEPQLRANLLALAAP